MASRVPDLIPEVKSEAKRLGKGVAHTTQLPAAQAQAFPTVPSPVWNLSCSLGHWKPMEPRRGVVAGEGSQGGGALLARWTMAVSKSESRPQRECLFDFFFFFEGVVTRLGCNLGGRA